MKKQQTTCFRSIFFFFSIFIASSISVESFSLCIRDRNSQSTNSHNANELSFLHPCSNIPLFFVGFFTHPLCAYMLVGSLSDERFT